MPVKHFAGTKDPETRVMRTPLCGYSVSGGVVTLTVSYVGFMALTNTASSKRSKADCGVQTHQVYAANRQLRPLSPIPPYHSLLRSANCFGLSADVAKAM